MYASIQAYYTIQYYPGFEFKIPSPPIIQEIQVYNTEYLSITPKELVVENMWSLKWI